MASITARSVYRVTGGYVEPPEQVCEELLKQGAGAFAVLEFGGAEAEYLVFTELEVPVPAHVGCVLGAVWSAVSAGVVPGSVHFEVAPSEAVASDGAVVDQDFVRVFDDLDVVVDGIAEPDVGLGQRGKDEILRPPG